MSKNNVARAKMVVSEVLKSGFNNGDGYQNTDRVKCVSVSESKNYSGFNYLMNGELSLTIANPNLVGSMQPGKTFYLYIALA